MNLKPGVTLDGLRPEITRILPDIEGLFNQAGLPLTITCTTDEHPEDDPHTHGMAVDCRTHGLSPIEQKGLAVSIQHKLGSDYFVQNEFPGQDQEHVHCQYRIDLWHAIVEKENHE